ncbi:hypothetical protein BESB_007030 [Besnoitia besnoiti]|uniref:PHD-type domain-containing protein n=1 Tax=Besnoitia besnoiti TaxID=94643 RepID=A0A2A9MQN5_BESBE|nr:hypothetical protein BESB_007030 [Besnoitia besnoiti]PFH38362.1 hypothetical protein BESB_007030 [Besnoitia besnoiti]
MATEGRFQRGKPSHTVMPPAAASFAPENCSVSQLAYLTPQFLLEAFPPINACPAPLSCAALLSSSSGSASSASSAASAASTYYSFPSSAAVPVTQDSKGDAQVFASALVAATHARVCEEGKERQISRFVATACRVLRLGRGSDHPSTCRASVSRAPSSLPLSCPLPRPSPQRCTVEPGDASADLFSAGLCLSSSLSLKDGEPTPAAHSDGTRSGAARRLASPLFSLDSGPNTALETGGDGDAASALRTALREVLQASGAELLLCVAYEDRSSSALSPPDAPLLAERSAAACVAHEAPRRAAAPRGAERRGVPARSGVSSATPAPSSSAASAGRGRKRSNDLAGSYIPRITASGSGDPGAGAKKAEPPRGLAQSREEEGTDDGRNVLRLRSDRSRGRRLDAGAPWDAGQVVPRSQIPKALPERTRADSAASSPPSRLSRPGEKLEHQKHPIYSLSSDTLRIPAFAAGFRAAALQAVQAFLDRSLPREERNSSKGGLQAPPREAAHLPERRRRPLISSTERREGGAEDRGGDGGAASAPRSPTRDNTARRTERQRDSEETAEGDETREASGGNDSSMSWPEEKDQQLNAVRALLAADVDHETAHTEEQISAALSPEGNGGSPIELCEVNADEMPLLHIWNPQPRNPCAIARLRPDAKGVPADAKGPLVLGHVGGIVAPVGPQALAKAFSIPLPEIPLPEALPEPRNGASRPISSREKSLQKAARRRKTLELCLTGACSPSVSLPAASANAAACPASSLAPASPHPNASLSSSFLASVAFSPAACAVDVAVPQLLGVPASHAVRPNCAYHVVWVNGWPHVFLCSLPGVSIVPGSPLFADRFSSLSPQHQRRYLRAARFALRSRVVHVLSRTAPLTRVVPLGAAFAPQALPPFASPARQSTPFFSGSDAVWHAQHQARAGHSTAPSCSSPAASPDFRASSEIDCTPESDDAMMQGSAAMPANADGARNVFNAVATQPDSSSPASTDEKAAVALLELRQAHAQRGAARSARCEVCKRDSCPACAARGPPPDPPGADPGGKRPVTDSPRPPLLRRDPLETRPRQARAKRQRPARGACAERRRSTTAVYEDAPEEDARRHAAHADRDTNGGGEDGEPDELERWRDGENEDSEQGPAGTKTRPWGSRISAERGRRRTGPRTRGDVSAGDREGREAGDGCEALADLPANRQQPISARTRLAAKTSAPSSLSSSAPSSLQAPSPTAAGSAGGAAPRETPQSTRVCCALLTCDLCARSFHLQCLGLPVDFAPDPVREWLCFVCVQRGQQLAATRGALLTFPRTYAERDGEEDAATEEVDRWRTDPDSGGWTVEVMSLTFESPEALHTQAS